MSFTHWIRLAVLVTVAPSITIFAQAFKAGAGQSDIQTTPAMFPVAEFSGQHDPATVRILVLDDSTQQIAILTVDTPSIQDPSVVGWKAIVTKTAGINTENVLVIATHDTSAPHITPAGVMAITAEAHGLAPGTVLGPAPGAQNAGGPHSPTAAQITGAKAYARAVDDAVEIAATKAVATLQPVQVGFGLGTSRVNISSQMLTPKGWTNGLNDEGFTDTSLALIRFTSLDGKPVAWLMDYAVRPAIMERSKTESGGALISGDLIGVARHYLETQYGSSATAIFLMGAASDQQPLFTAVRSAFDKDGNSSRIDIHEAGFTLVDLIGERLGGDAVRVNESIKTSITPTKLRLVRQSIEVETQARQQPNGAVPAAASLTGQKVAIPYVLLQIGDIAIVGAKHELNATTGVKIRAESPFPHTIVATMVDGSNGSMEDVNAYDRRTSASLNSYYARGSAEAVVDAIEAQLKLLHDTH
jgi:hypothetical protein